MEPFTWNMHNPITSVYDTENTMILINTEILNRLKEYLASIGDTETTYSAIIAQWIDKQKIADMRESAK